MNRTIGGGIRVNRSLSVRYVIHLQQRIPAYYREMLPCHLIGGHSLESEHEGCTYCEEMFFRSRPVYSDLAYRCGVPQLARKLNQHIKTILPGLKARISAALVSVAKEHASYGEITESKGALLHKILPKYSEVDSHTQWPLQETYRPCVLSGSRRPCVLRRRRQALSLEYQ